VAAVRADLRGAAGRDRRVQAKESRRAAIASPWTVVGLAATVLALGASLALGLVLVVFSGRGWMPPFATLDLRGEIISAGGQSQAPADFMVMSAADLQRGSSCSGNIAASRRRTFPSSPMCSGRAQPARICSSGGCARPS